jgi:acyl-CoA reductase-like NAD-dependent aldehyde dehydrogenase
MMETKPRDDAARTGVTGSIRPEVPFGGFGESGLGRELGAHGLVASTEPKSLFVSV